MAGIGFKLKKLFVEGSYISNVAAYFYSSVVIIGPMLICMSIILLAKTCLKALGADYLQIETLTSTIVYCFIFSMILTGGLGFITSRYVSDCLFAGRLDDIMQSYDTMQAIVAALSGILALAFLAFSPLGLLVKALTYLLFVVLSLIWIDMIYITAFKEYSRIILSFVLGFLAMVAIGFLATRFIAGRQMEALLGSILIGFVLLHTMLSIHIRGFFKPNGSRSGGAGILGYLKQHKLLLAIGFLLTAAPYMHNFVFWFSSYGVVVADTYRYCPTYDIPSFYAILTIIPTIVMFVVSMETNFYDKYRNFYFLVLNEGIVHEIKLAKKEMEDTLLSQIARMMEIQLMFSFIAIVGGIYLLSMIGFTTLFVNVFTSLALGSLVYIFLDITILVLLYFDDIKGALVFTSAFFCFTILFSIASVLLGSDFFGYGYFLSGLLCLAGCLLRLFFYVRNVKYYTYCKQPLMKEVANPIIEKEMGGSR